MSLTSTTYPQQQQQQTATEAGGAGHNTALAELLQTGESAEPYLLMLESWYLSYNLDRHGECVLRHHGPDYENVFFYQALRQFIRSLGTN